MTFDSQKELRRFNELKLLERANEISHLEHQKVFELAPSVVLSGRKKPALRYVADFAYFDKKRGYVVEDVKSLATAKLSAFVIKRHLMKSVHGIEVDLI